MIAFDIRRLFPDFILGDKNGYAMARAIEAGLKAMCETIQTGVDTAQDVDKMPEWRLDEMAWELNCLYDYDASVEIKRRWIRDATPLMAAYGTPQAVYNFLESYFDNVDLEENWQYGGEAYHFRVTVEGAWTAENEAWARTAIETAKNVRSVLDGLRIGHRCLIGITAEGGVLGRFGYPMTGAENYAGRWPQTNTLGTLDESGRIATGASAVAQTFFYPMTGTKPEINTLGALSEAAAGADASARGYSFGYGMTSEDRNTGTAPDANTLGALDESAAGIETAAEGYAFDYPLTGTTPQISTEGVTEGIIPSAQAEDGYAKVLYKMCGQDEI